MKKGLLILLSVLVITLLGAFPQRTINPGGYLSFSSIKDNSDADAISVITVAPQVGYFVIDNLAIDGLVSYQDFDGDSALGIGVGGRYFYKNFYGGLGLMYESWDSGSSTNTGMYLDPKLGYVVPLARNVYFDLGLDYKMGFGQYGGDAADFDIDNEESALNFKVGLQIYYLTK